ncbi:MAG TPA: hypothetical protein VMU20_10785 [Candidatus Dormibacteraeota bacterium]|nr:hypothetical protein [Candidatus Dormibacteraeota bacterium]
MSARRELFALWTRCDTLREQLGAPDAGIDPDARRLLEAASVELAGAARRLDSAGMLAPAHVRELEEAREALIAARDGALSPTTAIARFAFAVQEVAAACRVPLTPLRNPDGNGVSVEIVPASTATAVDALAHAGSLAAAAGHRLSGFAGSGAGNGHGFTARCSRCRGEVRVERLAGVWTFSGVARCAPAARLAAPS